MRAMRVLLTLAVVMACAIPALAGEDLFEFDRLSGIPTANLVVRDIAGGGLPWRIAHGEASLQANGALRVEVEGLVLDAGPNAGKNPAPQFMATLSCLNADGTTHNISTAPQPATVTGNARIKEVLTLPTTCLAPMVFVRGVIPQPTGPPRTPWFAISGF